MTTKRKKSRKRARSWVAWADVKQLAERDLYNRQAILFDRRCSAQAGHS